MTITIGIWFQEDDQVKVRDFDVIVICFWLNAISFDVILIF